MIEIEIGVIISVCILSAMVGGAISFLCCLRELSKITKIYREISACDNKMIKAQDNLIKYYQRYFKWSQNTIEFLTRIRKYEADNNSEREEVGQE